MSAEFVNIEVNGVAVKAPKGEMIIRVTDANGAYIPRFCYHDKLAIAANCRMCLVEVEKAPKPMPACATPVAEGMKIFTRSPKAIAAQKATMEFLLINHPLDCPICDQGGECELQDLAVGFGRDISRYDERKRVVKDLSLGPLVSTDMTRCIHCTRCVRFGQDIAGIQELGTTGRGENMQIGTFIEHSVDHELSGNIIDLCPVGALNSKPFRFQARAWEMTQHPLVSPHDGFGTRLYGHVLRGQLMRVVPQPCEEINETWIADRDRFSYQGLDSRRPAAAAAHAREQWQLAGHRLGQGARARRPRALRTRGGRARQGLGFLAHPSSTLEELYLLGRVAQGLGCANIDHRLRQRDFRDQGERRRRAPGLGLPLADVDQLDALFIVGSNLRAEMPMLAHRVRKAALRGARDQLAATGALQISFPRGPVAERLALRRWSPQLAAVLQAALTASRGRRPPVESRRLLADVTVNDAHRAIAESLEHRPARHMARRAGPASFGVRGIACCWRASWRESRAPRSANCSKAPMPPAPIWPAACRIAARPVKVAQCRRQECARHARDARWRGYLLLGTEPWADSAQPEALVDAGELHPSWCRDRLCLPGHAGGRAGAAARRRLCRRLGHLCESRGSLAEFCRRRRAPGAARPAWKILRVLGNLLDLPDFDYQSSEQVRDELRAAVDQAPTPAVFGGLFAGRAPGQIEIAARCAHVPGGPDAAPCQRAAADTHRA